MRPLEVGIMSAPLIRCSMGEAIYKDGKILYKGQLFKELLFNCEQFTLYGVTIGVNFHWQRQQTQMFKGKLKIIVEGEMLTAVNVLDVEDYLASVISSEMSANSHIELLKAHAIISRSWLLHPLFSAKKVGHGKTEEISDNRIIRIYERMSHKNFDVCADDHCQRYQGLAVQTSPNVGIAIDATRSMVLTYKGEICDTRFYKCCGGRTELFETCWADEPHPYLESVKDDFCNTHDKQVLSQVLNDYDLETNDFHDWKVVYSQEQLSDLVRLKSGIDFGLISELVALKRGASGRIYELKIIGDKCSVIVGKELEIRRWLSPSHLYSSNFEVKKSEDADGRYFTLIGHGWGHGVGLCQIGAAAMANQGYSYKEILRYYFPKAEITLL